jgi:hypothetical protein
MLAATTNATLPDRGAASALLEEAACELEWRDFDTLYESLAVYQPTVADYFQGGGTKLGGSATLSSPLKPEVTGKEPYIGRSDSILRVGECVATLEGSTWYTQRVGPFKSRGGYDWWDYYHYDFRSVTRLLDSLKAGEQLGVTAHVSGPMGAGFGEIIPLPPLHNHHMHVVPGTGEYHTNAEDTAMIDCILRGVKCYDGTIFIQHHGDYQCSQGSGGVECFGRDYTPYAKLFARPLSINVQVNDVRPANAKPMVWWFQLSMRLTTVTSSGASKVRSLSAHTIGPPGPLTFPMETFATTDVPSDVDSLLYYTGRWPFAGTVRGMDWHSHMLRFQGALIAACTKEEMGLHATPFQAVHPWVAIRTVPAGFADNLALKAHLLGHLERTMGSLDALMCDIKGNTELVEQPISGGARRVDRLWTGVCHERHFALGDVFTSACFNGPPIDQLPRGERAGGMFAGMAGANSDGTEFPQHLNGFVYYQRDDGPSSYTLATCTTAVDALDISITSTDLLRLVIGGGSPSGPPTLFDEATIAFLRFVLYVYDALSSSPLLGLLIVVIAIDTIGRRIWLAVPALCSCCVLPIFALTVVYWLVLFINSFLIPGYVFMPSMQPEDGAAIAARARYGLARSSTLGMSPNVIALAVGVLLVALTGWLVLFPSPFGRSNYGNPNHSNQAKPSLL